MTIVADIQPSIINQLLMLRVYHDLMLVLGLEVSIFPNLFLPVSLVLAFARHVSAVFRQLEEGSLTPANLGTAVVPWGKTYLVSSVKWLFVASVFLI